MSQHFPEESFIEELEQYGLFFKKDFGRSPEESFQGTKSHLHQQNREEMTVS